MRSCLVEFALNDTKALRDAVVAGLKRITVEAVVLNFSTTSKRANDGDTTDSVPSIQQEHSDEEEDNDGVTHAPPPPTLLAVVRCCAAALDCSDPVAVAGIVADHMNCTFQSWLDACASLVDRKRNLAPDRDIDELLASFVPTTVEGGFKPHLFSFDGTPVVALPQADRDSLGRILREMVALGEAYRVSDCVSIATDCRTASRLFSDSPSESLLAKIMAAAREGCLKTMGKRPYLVQCSAVIAFFLPRLAQSAANSAHNLKGRIGQIGTGEGKSIIVALTALLCALQGENVDVITTSQPLARRDAVEFEPLLRLFGVTGGSIAVSQPTRSHFNHNVLYGTNTDFEFAQLREGVFCKQIRYIDRTKSGTWEPRRTDVAIVDESDSLFLDMAQNSARIAHTTGMSFVWVYKPIFDLVRDYLSRTGVPPSTASVREMLQRIDNGQYRLSVAKVTDAKLKKWVVAALVAQRSHTKDRDYVVRNGRVIIVDHRNTGRLQIGSRWSGGIHEMVEVKEGLRVEPESGTIASISHPSFFQSYKTVIGITGTAGEPEERDEITRLFRVDSFDVPPHRRCLRRRLPTIVFKANSDKCAAMVASTREMCRTRAVLILVSTVQESHEFSALLPRVSTILPLMSSRLRPRTLSSTGQGWLARSP